MRTLGTTLATLALTASLTGCGADADHAAADLEDPRSSPEAAARTHLAAVVDKDWQTACDQYLTGSKELIKTAEDRANCLSIHRDMVLKSTAPSVWEAAQQAAADEVVVQEFREGKAERFVGPGDAGVDVYALNRAGGWWVAYGDVEIDKD